MMYCPEANVLVPRAVDPESKTPAFKNVLVTVQAEAFSREAQPSATHSWREPRVALGYSLRQLNETTAPLRAT